MQDNLALGNDARARAALAMAAHLLIIPSPEEVSTVLRLRAPDLQDGEANLMEVCGLSFESLIAV